MSIFTPLIRGVIEDSVVTNEVFGGFPVPLLFMPLVSDLSLTQGTGEATFTRSTQATFVNKESGLVELAPHNFFIRSEEFDNAIWVKEDSTISANAITSPIGTLTADSFEAGSTALITPEIRQTFSVVASSIYTVSFHVRKKDVDFVQLRYFDGHVTGNPRANFDISEGVLGTVDAENIATITELEDGWVRITATVVPTGSSLIVYFTLIKTATDIRSAGNTWTTGEGVYMWGAQLEERSSVGTYVSTEASVAYGPRFESEGILIEGASTNLILQNSDYANPTWSIPLNTGTRNFVTGQITGLNAVQFIAASERPFLSQNISVNTDSTYTLSCFIEDVEDIGSDGLCLVINAAVGGQSSARVSDAVNGKISITFTTGATSLVGVRFGLGASSSASGNITLSGIQLEELPFASSYIRTLGTSVTRAADLLSIPGTNFPSDPSTYTVALEASVFSGETINTIFYADQGSSADRVQIAFLGSNNINHLQTVGGVSQFGLSYNVTDVSLNSMYVTTFEVNNARAYEDGILKNSDTNAIALSGGINNITIGRRDLVENMYGHVKDLRFYKNILTPAQVASL